MNKPVKLTTRDIIDQIAQIDDRLIDLQTEAEARSFGAVSGNQDDIDALAENRSQRGEWEARRAILEGAKAQALRNEAADREAADAERVKQHEKSIRQNARKLRLRAVRVDAMFEEFSGIYAEMVQLEGDIRTYRNRIGQSFDGRTGQGQLAASAVDRMGAVNQPKHKQGRSIVDLADNAWGDVLGDAD